MQFGLYRMSKENKPLFGIQVNVLTGFGLGFHFVVNQGLILSFLIVDINIMYGEAFDD